MPRSYRTRTKGKKAVRVMILVFALSSVGVWIQSKWLKEGNFFVPSVAVLEEVEESLVIKYTAISSQQSDESENSSSLISFSRARRRRSDVSQVDVSVWIAAEADINTDDCFVTRELRPETLYPEYLKLFGGYIRLETKWKRCSRHAAAAAASSYQKVVNDSASSSSHPPCPQPCNAHETFHHATRECRSDDTDDTNPSAVNADWHFVLYCRGQRLPEESEIASFLYKDKSIPQAQYEIRKCAGTSCPKPCPNHANETTYPLYRDKVDGLCKSTYPSALPPNRFYGGPCSYTKTCFLPEVGDPQSSWPWKSHKQREEFYEGTPPDDSCADLRERQTLMPDYKDSSACEAAENKQREPENPTGLKLRCQDHFAGSHHLFFLPEARLIFCGIPKNGISEWIKFFRYTYGAPDYLSIPHFKSDREEFLLSNIPVEKANELLNDPTWTRAVILRDPAERLLSAFLDKVDSRHSPHEHYPGNFSDFVDVISDPNTDCSNPRGLHRCTDPHFAPQMFVCGLDSLLPVYDFIGNMQYLSTHTKLLLQRVRLWGNYGVTFDPVPIRTKMHSALPSSDRNKTLLGFNQRPPADVTHTHSKNAKNKMAQYYTDELLAKVRKAYAMDYAVWDEIGGRAPEDVASGYDLAHVKEVCRTEPRIPN